MSVRTYYIPTDSDRKKIKALQKGKVTYSQVEINNCLRLGYMS